MTAPRYACRVLIRNEAQISRALAGGSNLTNVTLFSGCPLWHLVPPPPDPIELVGIIAREFLSHSSEMGDKKRPEERALFDWEHELGLRRINVNCKYV